MKTLVRRLAVLQFIVAIAVSCASGLQAQNDTLVARLKAHINYLASEQLAGRYPGTDGNRMATEYVANTFRNYGLVAAGQNFTQNFSVPNSVSMTGNNSVNFEILIPKPFVPNDQLKPMKISWKAGVDYTPLGFSESSTASGTLCFVGYGITDKAKNYDDFANIDAKGKIAIILAGNPESYNPHARFRTDAAVRTRSINAREHGAVGVIFIHPQGDSAEVLMPLHFDSKSNSAGIPVIHVRRSVVTRIFPKDQPLILKEQEIVKTKQPRSFDIPNTSVSISVSLAVEETTVSNVVAMVPGTERPDEYIVVGAHCDHLGYGDENSLYSGHDRRIHYGADDNASGTAGVLELASLFRDNPVSRTVVFVAFNAEERGLLGSVHYVRNPIVPLEKTVCMVNLDMIGRLKDNKLNAQGVGSSSRWKALLDSVNQSFNFNISTTDDGFGPSDHSSFYSKDVPVLFFFTGLHTDYHRPSDTPDKINYQGEATVVKFTEMVIRQIASWNERPDFVKVKRAQSASTGFNVVFGVIPDYSDHPKGLHITGVREGAPAQKAGLLADDIIIKFGSTTVKNIYDLTYALGQHQPGDNVQVVVLRGPREDKEVTLSVTLVGK